MAKPKKTPEGTWRVQFMVGGIRDGGTFGTKRECEEYQARRTTELKTVKAGRVGDLKTLRDALRKYAEEVSPTKRGERWELVRLHAYERHALPIDRLITELTTDDLSAWRDARLKTNKPGSVLRDISLLSDVFEFARRDWKWIEQNPLRDMRKPASPRHRERVIQPRETREMLRALGYARRVRSVSQAVAYAFLLALSTGMRAGEIAGLTWARVKSDHVHLPMTKNGTARDVPLSAVSQKIIQRMEGWDQGLVFGISTQTLDAMFRRARNKAGLSGFTFHDARHTACTRIGLARRITALDLCKMMGWKRLDQALVYFNPTASQIASML
jgi:integrase